MAKELCKASLPQFLVEVGSSVLPRNAVATPDDLPLFFTLSTHTFQRTGIPVIFLLLDGFAPLWKNWGAEIPTCERS